MRLSFLLIVIRPPLSNKDITVLIEHLIFHELWREHLFLIHGHLSLSHDYARLLSPLNVYLKDLLMKLFNHCDIGLFEVSDAELKKLQLFPQLSQKATFFISEERVVVLLVVGGSLGVR